jgi:hypothetical protein
MDGNADEPAARSVLHFVLEWQKPRRSNLTAFHRRKMP